jgi:hypothetical protein
MLFLSSCTCFQPCMVLHKTTQHGSTCSFIHQFKNNVDILHIGGSARMNYSRALLCCDWADTKSEPPKHRFRRWGKYDLFSPIQFKSETLRQNNAVLRRAALSGPKLAPNRGR